MEESFILKFKIKLARKLHRIGLKNRNFTIVSNNCWGGYVYQEFGLRYNTPFIGLFIYAEDYIKLLKNFRYYMNQELKFIDISKSKYIRDVKSRKDRRDDYPVGILEDIELHFLHYNSEIEAKNKWNRRKKRINYSNILFKFSDNDLCCRQYVEEFSKLKYKNKICFVAQNYELNSVIQLKEFAEKECVEGEWSVSRRYIDNKKLLNEMVIYK